MCISCVSSVRGFIWMLCIRDVHMFSYSLFTVLVFLTDIGSVNTNAFKFLIRDKTIFIYGTTKKCNICKWACRRVNNLFCKRCPNLTKHLKSLFVCYVQARSWRTPPSFTTGSLTRHCFTHTHTHKLFVIRLDKHFAAIEIVKLQCSSASLENNSNKQQPSH